MADSGMRNYTWDILGITHTFQWIIGEQPADAVLVGLPEDPELQFSEAGTGLAPVRVIPGVRRRP